VLGVVFIAVFCHHLLLPKAMTSGVIELDEYTFDKIVDGSRTVLVQFFEYSWNEVENLEKIGKEFASNKNVLIAKVNTKNQKLVEKYAVKETPALFLFTNTDQYELYSGNLFAGDIIDFVALSTNSELRELKRIAEGYQQSKNQEKDAERIKELVSQLPSQYADVGAYYQDTLARVQNQGDTYITNEIARLQKLSSNKYIKPEKAEEFEKRLRVLNAFKTSLPIA